MERRRAKDVLVPLALSTIGIVALAHISLFGFTTATKEKAKERQGNLCPVCGQPLCSHRHVEGHHAVPRSLGGNDSVLNCVEVGGDVRGRDCHEILDQKALHGTIFLPPDGPFMPITEAPPELFKNEGVRQRTVRRFSVGEIIEGTIHVFRKKKRKERKGHRRGNKGRR